MTTPAIDLESLTLARGSHGYEFTGQVCLVEVSNLIAAGVVRVPEALLPACPVLPAPFGDDHPSISRVIRAYAIALNDAVDDETRQQLLPYAPRLLCTATTEADEEARAWMALDWLVRVHMPAWLRLAGLDKQARLLESVARIVDPITATATQPALDRARAASTAAWADASTAARAAARAVAWHAARAAARAVARAVAWHVASTAASTAARDVASTVAWYVARDVASTVAWDVARDVARVVAWDVARAALRPTVVELQRSAVALLDEMIRVGRREEVSRA